MNEFFWGKKNLGRDLASGCCLWCCLRFEKVLFINNCALLLVFRGFMLEYWTRREKVVAQQGIFSRGEWSTREYGDLGRPETRQPGFRQCWSSTASYWLELSKGASKLELFRMVYYYIKYCTPSTYDQFYRKVQSFRSFFEGNSEFPILLNSYSATPNCEV